MIVCPEPLAAEVGQHVFAAGGNAADAVVAAAFAQAVTNPLLCGIGGTGILHYYDGRKRQSTILNFRGSIGSRPAPEKWRREYVGRAETIGRYILRSEENQVGYRSIMTPGFVRGCWIAFQRLGTGRLSWADLLAPSIRLAREGFDVYPYVAAFWSDREERPGYPGLKTKLRATQDAWRIYLKPDGSVYEEGDRFEQPALAQTLQRLADVGGEDFYTGEIARIMAKDLAERGGLVSADDLRDFPVELDVPLRGQYRGLEVTSTPFSSGAHIIQMLQILEHFDLVRLDHNTPEYIDTFGRVQRASFADSVRLKGMSRERARPLEQEVISPARAAFWAERIEAGDRISVRGGSVSQGTTHVVCMDAEHSVASFTHSIGSLAGSGVVTPGLGFLYNNFLGHFNPLPGQPDSIATGKKQTGSPATIMFKDSEPYIAIGAPGGSRIVTSVAQCIVNVVDHGMNMGTAVSLPRFHSEERQLVFLEPAFPGDTERTLRAMGNEVERSSYTARVQAIRVRPEDGKLEPGPDPRGGAGVGSYP
jgi:gamma-glutamyltranspeptidase/glutathione hydrolase